MNREFPSRPVVGVGAVIVITPADRHLLDLPAAASPWGVVLVRRRFEPLAGQWSIPGGVLEIGETLAAGVAREAAEETGLAVEVGPVIDVIDRILSDPDRRVRYHFVLIDYLCRPIGGRLEGASDAAAVAIADAATLQSFGLTAQADGVIRRALDLACIPGESR